MSVDRTRNISSHNITSETDLAAKECVSVYTFHHLEMMDHVNRRTFSGNVNRGVDSRSWTLGIEPDLWASADRILINTDSKHDDCVIIK